MTIALVSLAELMAITLRLQMLGRNETAAVRLAQDKIDELMTQNFNTALTVSTAAAAWTAMRRTTGIQRGQRLYYAPLAIASGSADLAACRPNASGF